MGKGKCFNKEDCSGCSGVAYIFGVIGATVYYLSVTTGFWMSILALLKSLVWPAFLVYGLLKMVGA